MISLSNARNQKFQYVNLLLASFIALYFELVIIRYLSTEIRVFAYLKNLPLIASFFGLGLGMIMNKKEKVFAILFPFSGLLLFLIIRFASTLDINHLPLPGVDYFIWGTNKSISPYIDFMRYAGAITVISLLIVFFCMPIGSLISKYLDYFPPLRGYSINLIGSIAGIVVFTLMSYLGTPPWIWIGFGSLILLWLYWGQLIPRIIFFILPLLVISTPENVLWSPYYRISLEPQLSSPREPKPSFMSVSVNHDYHQKILDLSSAFFEKNPKREPNYSALLTYDLPFLSHPGAKSVLILGAGTGNDVAAALRHGAEYIDAVEIDPVILDIGKKFHPEQPYDSHKVRVRLDDARSFMRKTTQRYDLVVFAFLDSHTLLANSSSLRLDNYVYTEESLEEAKNLLKPEGTMVLAFAAGKSFVSARIYKMLKNVFNKAPSSYGTAYDRHGVVFVSGENALPGDFSQCPIINDWLEKEAANILPATDDWPFLYLRERNLPDSYYVLFLFLLLAWVLAKLLLPMKAIWTSNNLHFFMLGAAFLLLETKAITELALLFGSTWIVNTIAILAFLLMAFMANLILTFSTPSRKILYILLFISLTISIVFPLKILTPLQTIPKIFFSGLILALPVFFSAMLFSRAFRETHSPGESLGVNLMGALIGGIAENAVMIGGMLLLEGIAVIFYIISLVAIIFTRKSL
jgi:SAM-dependent methyltransferase